MIWIWAVAGAIMVGLILRLMATTKIHVLKLQAKYQGKFFEYANEITDWEDIPVARLDAIAELASSMRSRKAQFLLGDAIRRAVKQERREKRERVNTRNRDLSLSDLDEGQRRLWAQMFFRWMLATCAQGSFLAVGSLLKALEYFDPDDDGDALSISALHMKGMSAGAH